MPINCASKNIWSGCSGRLHVKKSPIKPLAGYRTNYLPKIERNSHCNRMGCNAWILSVVEMLKLVGTLYALLIPMGPGSRRSGGFITLAWGCRYYLLKVDYNLPGFYHFHFCQFLFFIGRLLDGCMLQPGRFLKTDFKRRLKINLGGTLSALLCRIPPRLQR